MRARTIIRFAEPDLHAELLSRIVMDNIVVDHEKITPNFPEGRGSLEMMCVYEIKDGLIQKFLKRAGDAALIKPDDETVRSLFRRLHGDVWQRR